ncbi:MAG TPA: RDD family protein [Pseudonocardiaceae bacterium]|jgi:hypothetical protein|nr:RDD family protein [Pseudonocardiaceae bacterium]
MEHGSQGDPRYPSPRRLRTTLAFAVDLVLALGALVGTFVATRHQPTLPVPALVAIAAMIVVSFVNRVLIQSIFRASIGEALFGLRLIRKSDGGRPGLWALLRAWLLSIVWGIATMAEIAGSANSGANPTSAVFPSVVRRRDVRLIS